MDERECRFRRIYEPTYRPVLAYALRRSPPEEADDVVAETFAIAWRRLDDVPEHAPLPWLYGVARRVLANRRRARRRWNGLRARLAREPAAPDTSGEARPILAALASLRPSDQEVLRLAVWERLSHAEIGAILGCSANAAAIRLHRARRRLADALKEIETTGQEQERWAH